MALIDDIIKQNTKDTYEALAVGVPASWDWYHGWMKTGYAPAAGITAVTGWLACYPELNAAQPNYNARVETRNFRTWVRLKATKKWVEVQAADAKINGGLWGAAMTGGQGLTATRPSTGIQSVPCPQPGLPIMHWWPEARGTYGSGTVDASYTQAEIRVTDAAQKLVGHIGVDYWRDGAAPYVDPVGTNNPAAGISSFIRLTTTFRTVGFYTCSDAVFKESLPPPLAGATVPPVVDPPVVVPPVTPAPTGFTGQIIQTYANGLLTKAEVK